MKMKAFAGWLEDAVWPDHPAGCGRDLVLMAGNYAELKSA